MEVEDSDPPPFIFFTVPPHRRTDVPQAVCTYCGCHSWGECLRCGEHLCAFHALWSRHRNLCFPKNRKLAFSAPIGQARYADASEVRDLWEQCPITHGVQPSEFTLAVCEDTIYQYPPFPNRYLWTHKDSCFREQMVYQELAQNLDSPAIPLESPLAWPSNRSPWYFFENEYLQQLQERVAFSCNLNLFGRLILTDIKVLHTCCNPLVGQWYSVVPKDVFLFDEDVDLDNVEESSIEVAALHMARQWWSWKEWAVYLMYPDCRNANVERVQARSDLLTTYGGNVNILAWYGAGLDQATLSPHDKVSGWAVSDVERARGIRNAVDLMQSDEVLQMLVWGSPHKGTSTSLFEDRAGFMGTPGPAATQNKVYKSHAFYAMLWQTRGVVLMTFPSKYEVEFPNPRSDPCLHGRVLLIDKAIFHLHRPLCGTPHGIQLIEDGEGGCTMVAIAFPRKYFRCIHVIEDDNPHFGGIDVTRTYLCLLNALLPNERAVVLGGYNFDMEAEAVKYFEHCIKYDLTDKFLPYTVRDNTYRVWPRHPVQRPGNFD